MASWDDEYEKCCVSTLTSNFSKINVDAPEFIPGQPYDFLALKRLQETNQSIDKPELKHSNSDMEFINIQNDNVNMEIVNQEADKPLLPEIKRKETISLVFIGHVDAGKSTIGGHLLYLTGMVDQRTIEKYAKEAKEKNRETWYLSWALDTNSEERDKGKTVECGRAYFETKQKHFILVDAPGHKSFVPNMIVGASIADLAILVISARRGEFETGFEKGGQTREHAMLVKTTGVKHLIVLINKMDDPTVMWDESRYIECREKLIPFLKKIGFNTKSDVYVMPCSGYTGAFLQQCPAESICSWYRGPSLLDYLDNLEPFQRSIVGPVRMPLFDKYKDMGTFVVGKLESGKIYRGQSLVIMPTKITTEVLQVCVDDIEVEGCVAGENCKLKLKNIEEEDISSGFVLCSPDNLCHVANVFDAHVVIVDYKSIICPGFSAVMHIHASIVEVRFRLIICRIDKKTNKKTDIKPRFIKQDDSAIVRFDIQGGTICMECFKDLAQMGRFTLRDEGKTIAIGKIVKILNQSPQE